MNMEWTTFWAAFGGGASAGMFTLATVLLAEWLRWFNDRPLLKISTRVGRIVGGHFSYSGPEVSPEVLFLEARNPHTRPVTVSNFGLLHKSKEYPRSMIMPQQGYIFPYRVEGGTSLTQWTDVTQLFESLQERRETPSDIKGIWFRSSSGKEYKGKLDKHIIQELEKGFDR